MIPHATSPTRPQAPFTAPVAPSTTDPAAPTTHPATFPAASTAPLATSPMPPATDPAAPVIPDAIHPTHPAIPHIIHVFPSVLHDPSAQLPSLQLHPLQHGNGQHDRAHPHRTRIISHARATRYAIAAIGFGVTHRIATAIIINTSRAPTLTSLRHPLKRITHAAISQIVAIQNRVVIDKNVSPRLCAAHQIIAILSGSAPSLLTPKKIIAAQSKIRIIHNSFHILVYIKNKKRIHVHIVFACYWMLLPDVYVHFRLLFASKISTIWTILGDICFIMIGNI